MLTTEIDAEAVLGNVVTAIASTLRPVAMVGCPPLGPSLLPRAMPLPGTLLCPSPLLLPRGCLLLGPVRLLLGLLGTLPLLLWLRLLLGPLLLGLLRGL